MSNPRSRPVWTTPLPLPILICAALAVLGCVTTTREARAAQAAPAETAPPAKTLQSVQSTPPPAAQPQPLPAQAAQPIPAKSQPAPAQAAEIPAKASPAQALVPPAQPIAVRIVSAPDSESGLVTVTWILVGANALLCLITWFMARRSLQLTARQQREALIREVNVVANRAAVASSRVGQLAATLPDATLQLLRLSGQHQGMEDNHPSKVETRKRSERTEKISEDAIGVLNSKLKEKSDEELAATLRRMDGHVVHLEGMKEAVSADLARVESESRARRAENAETRLAPATLL